MDGIRELRTMLRSKRTRKTAPILSAISLLYSASLGALIVNLLIIILSLITRILNNKIIKLLDFRTSQNIIPTSPKIFSNKHRINSKFKKKNSTKGKICSILLEKLKNSKKITITPHKRATFLPHRIKNLV